jgi:hypothetical protein
MLCEPPEGRAKGVGYARKRSEGCVLHITAPKGGLQPQGRMLLQIPSEDPHLDMTPWYSDRGVMTCAWSSGAGVVLAPSSVGGHPARHGGAPFGACIACRIAAGRAVVCDQNRCRRLVVLLATFYSASGCLDVKCLVRGLQHASPVKSQRTSDAERAKH